MVYFITFFATLLICILLIKLSIITADPTSRGEYKQSVATSGGIALTIPLFLIMLLMIGVNENDLIYLMLLMTISLIGVADDFYDMNQVIRFTCSFVCVKMGRHPVTIWMFHQIIFAQRIG